MLQNHVSDNGTVWETSYEITCSATPTWQGQLPVFLTQLPAESGSDAQYIVTAQGEYAESPASSTVPEADVFPLLGPMGGGTEIMLQVRSFLMLCS